MKQMQKRTCMGIVLLILTLTMTACSTETITETYEQYRPQMERTAMHFLKSHADVEDAVQNLNQHTCEFCEQQCEMYSC
jgi:hypothetical protein